MNVFVETKRLILREILPSDLNGMYELDADPQVHSYLGNRPVKDKKEVEKIIDFIRKQYAENGIGRWAIIEKATNNFIGWTGLKLVREMTNNHINYYDLGYRLIKKYWGQGYATESALASLQYGFNKLQLEEIYAAAHLENNASNKILKNIGFNKVETFFYDNSEHNWYILNKAEWDKNN